MKVYIRTLWSEQPKPLWINDRQKEALKNYLNDLGFYVLSGVDDSLDVFAVSYETTLDIAILLKSLDKIQKSWYKLVGG